MLRALRVRVAIATAAMLGVPVKVRDAFWGAPQGTSHIVLEPSRTIAREPDPR